MEWFVTPLLAFVFGIVGGYLTPIFEGRRRKRDALGAESRGALDAVADVLLKRIEDFDGVADGVPFLPEGYTDVRELGLYRVDIRQARRNLLRVQARELRDRLTLVLDVLWWLSEMVDSAVEDEAAPGLALCEYGLELIGAHQRGERQLPTPAPRTSAYIERMRTVRGEHHQRVAEYYEQHQDHVEPDLR